MANGNISRGGEWIRPTFMHVDEGKLFCHDNVQSQLLESIRNILEDIADSQMLACSVAREITASRIALEKLARRRKRAPARKKR